MRRTLVSIFGVLLLLAVLFLVNGISDLLFGRFYVDLTEERLYSLSDGTKNILKGLDKGIAVKVYMSSTDGGKYPAVKIYGDRVISLLREYERASKGKLTLEIYDPRPDTDEESWAQKYGITPLDMPGGEKVFFGLAAVNSLGEEEVLPVFSLTRQEVLEHDITRLIYSLSQKTKPVIGVMSALKIKGSEQQNMPQFGAPPPAGAEPWILVNQLSKFAELRFIDPSVTSIDSAIKLLMVIHPKNLSEATLYAIDQFALSGGNLFVAVDPYCNIDRPENPENPQAAMMADRSSDLNRLLKTWGVELAEGKVVGDMNLATRVNTGAGQVADFVLWLSLRKGQQSEGEGKLINEEDLVSSQLDNLLFAWAGTLKLQHVEGVNSQVLVQTTPQAMLFEPEDYKFGGGQPEQLLSKYVKGDSPQVLAVRLSGKLKSSFSNKPEAVSSTQPHLADGAGVSHVVVVSDVDFLGDDVSAVSQNFLGARMVSLLNQNLVLAGNLAENLIGSSDLISLRSRGQFTRPFLKVQEIERQAEAKWRDQRVVLEAELNNANQRLNQLQSGNEKSGGQIFNQALLDEIKQFREKRARAQEQLRDLRRELRQDKERLGQWLFVINTFLVPLLLVLGVLFWHNRAQASGVSEKEN